MPLNSPKRIFLCIVLKPCRIQAEVDEVFGDKQDVDADDLDNMIYTKQVILLNAQRIILVLCTCKTRYWSITIDIIYAILDFKLA